MTDASRAKTERTRSTLLGTSSEQRDRLVAESRARTRLMMPEFGDPMVEMRKLMHAMFDQAFLDEHGHAMIFDWD